MSTPAEVKEPVVAATGPAFTVKTLLVIAVVAAAAWYLCRDKSTPPPAAPAT